MKPSPRALLPQRNDHHRKRVLATEITHSDVHVRFQGIRYGCSGKHKSNPYLYEVDPYRGPDTDRSLCDAHAEFNKRDIQRIPDLFSRAKAASLFGNLTWTVDDTGWIYELQVTNIGLNEWHGYPLLLDDTFARQVWARFAAWAAEHGTASDRAAAERCALLYGLSK